MWQFSAEIMFIDSSGGMDRQNYRVFLLLTHSPEGALPLGVIILPSEAQDTITAGLKLYNGLPSEAQDTITAGLKLYNGLPSEAQDTITAGLKLYNGLLPADPYFCPRSRSVYER